MPAPIVTVLDFITATMIDIGALTQGQTPNNSEAEYVFLQLNQMLDQMSTSRANLFSSTELVLPLSNKQTFQIGPGAADFPTQPRPTRIDNAAMVIPGTTIRIPLKLWNEVEWADLTERNRSGQAIDGVYCDYAYPFSNLNVSPIPTGAPTLSLFIWTLLHQFVTIQDPFNNFATGYQEPLMKALGVRLKSSFHSPMIDEVYIGLAQRAVSDIQSLNRMLFANSAMTDITAPAAGASPPAVSPQPSPTQPE